MAPPYTSPLCMQIQRKPLSWLADWPLETTSASHDASLRRSHMQLRAASNSTDWKGWMYGIPNEQRIGGIAVGCAIGTVVLLWILYACWKHCKPHPSYYETAVKLSKENPACECRERSDDSEETNSEIPPSSRASPPPRIPSPSRTPSPPWIHPVTVLDEPTAPEPVRVKFSTRIEMTWSEEYG